LFLECVQRIFLPMLLGEDLQYLSDDVTQAFLQQAAMYAQISASQEAHLLIFDRDGSQNRTSQEGNEEINKEGVIIEI